MVIPPIAIYGAISLLVEIFSAVLWYVVVRFYNTCRSSNKHAYDDWRDGRKSLSFSNEICQFDC